METIEERANKNSAKLSIKYGINQKMVEALYIAVAKEQKSIYKELIDMLINELYTSRAYHLGITGLDSEAERKAKERKGDCALIRSIDRTIKYVKEIMKE